MCVPCGGGMGYSAQGEAPAPCQVRLEMKLLLLKLLSLFHRTKGSIIRMFTSLLICFVAAVALVVKWIISGIFSLCKRRD